MLVHFQSCVMKRLSCVSGKINVPKRGRAPQSCGPIETALQPTSGSRPLTVLLKIIYSKTKYNKNVNADLLFE